MTQPKKVYRFQRFSENSLNALCHDQLFFSAPSAFNDPLECQPTVKQDTDLHHLRQIFEFMITNRIESEALKSFKTLKLEGQRTDEHSRRIAKNAAIQRLNHIAYNATDPEILVSPQEAVSYQLVYEIESELLAHYQRGICCFSTGYMNPLLWSHYADQHHGFCCGYTLNRQPIPELHKVIYGGSRTINTSLIGKAILERDPCAIEELDSRVLLRKASPWKYEKEWRIFNKPGLRDSPLSLVDITFGLRCPSGVVHAITKALESREDEVKFYKMTQVRGSFKLKRELLELYEIQSYLPHTAKSGFEIFGPVE